MVLEKIIFNVLALALFLIIFFKMIRKNDTNYIYLLIIQTLGIAISFIGLIFNINVSILSTIFTYILSIIIPILVILLENKGISLTEAIYISMSKMYILGKDDEKARKILIKLLNKYPNSFYGHKNLGQLYEKENLLDTAIEEYIRATNIKPEQYDLYFKIANLFNIVGKKNEASNLLTDILKRKPDFYEATSLLGDILYEQEKFKEAASVYLDALKYHPDNYDIYYNLGMVYTRSNDFQSAKEYYEKAAQLNSLLYYAKYNLGQIALLYDELDEAEEYFIECINEKELEENAYYYLAYISMLKGEEQKAIQYLNIAVEEDGEIYEKIRKELIFKIIFRKINKPTNEKVKQSKEKNKKTEKEKKTILHLENTYELVGNLNNNDIKAMETIKTKRIQGNEREF